MKNKLIHTLFFCLCCFSLSAQDIHFSQAEYAPMVLNPALSGIHGGMQANLNYRSQWTSVGNPYRTAAASFDSRLSKNKTKNYLGAGVFFMNDKAGNPAFTHNLIQLSLAYHASLNRRSSLSVGLYGGFGQKSIGDVSGKWATQYNGMSFNEALPSGETFNNPNFSYPDAGAGMVYYYSTPDGYMTQNKGRKFYAGASAYHANRPNASFIENQSMKLPVRLSAFCYAEIGVANTSGVWMPGLYYQLQGGARELLAGTYYKYLINSGSKYTGYEKAVAVSLGMFVRARDSFVAKGMISKGDYSLGISYDINTSSLATASRARGGYEIFLQYRGKR